VESRTPSRVYYCFAFGRTICSVGVVRSRVTQLRANLVGNRQQDAVFVLVITVLLVTRSLVRLDPHYVWAVQNLYRAASVTPFHFHPSIQ